MFRNSGDKMQGHSASFGRIRDLAAISPVVTGNQGDVASVRTEPEGKAQPRRKSPSGHVAEQIRETPIETRTYP
ncbi:hypothetical protein IWQ49_004800 [Labrenzia sp. EL_126]|nr:hypothetical protein [Labrenzia sp. EL_126]